MKIVILGTGSFALSIGYLLEKNNYSFTFMGRDKKQLKELEEKRRNIKYSSYEFKNPIKTLEIKKDFDFSSFDILFYCLPSSSIYLISNTRIPIIFTNKGFKDSFLFEKFSNYCILSGGSYAVEILNGIPCYLSLASTNKNLEKKVLELLESPYCILSFTNKIKDIEIFGIYKNIIAIFCGIIEELELGKNISSAFITKCLEYIINFYNLNYNSLLEPAGIGDLFLSCSSKKSRNFSYGSNLVKDNNYKSLKLVEGLNSLKNLKEKKINSLLSKLDNILLLLEKKKYIDTKTTIYSIILEN